MTDMRRVRSGITNEGQQPVDDLLNFVHTCWFEQFFVPDFEEVIMAAHSLQVCQKFAHCNRKHLLLHRRVETIQEFFARADFVGAQMTLFTIRLRVHAEIREIWMAMTMIGILQLMIPAPLFWMVFKHRRAGELVRRMQVAIVWFLVGSTLRTDNGWPT